MRMARQKWFYVLVMTAVVALFAVQACEKGAGRPSEDTVAIVNGTLITQGDLDAELSMMQKQFADLDKASDEQLAEIKRDILENLISREVLYQESQRKGIEVDEVTIDERLANIKKRLPQGEDFEGMLAEMHLTESDLRMQLREGMAIQKLVDREIIDPIGISDTESKDYYDKNPDLFKQPEKVQARHILIKIDPVGGEAKKAEALKKIKQVQKELKEGKPFPELAKKYSECPSSAEGGDLGYFARGQMVQPFEDVAFSLKKGETSGVVETSFGYHLIQAVDKKPEVMSSYDEVKDRLTQYLKRTKAGEEAEKYVERLKGKAKIERFLSAAEPQGGSE
ncbi:MAG: peptidylprolyl isomerase [Deltaproteobacteria bacterium]|nr:peptidylprolyl isomerase [Deltaproteobacteria bacterium]